MAKRARGASGRPGHRRANQRSAARSASTPSARPAPSVPSPAATGDAPDQVVESLDRSARSPRGRTRSASTSFSDSAAQEYAYVTADVRRIGTIAGALFATLAILFLLIDVLKIIHL